MNDKLMPLSEISRKVDVNKSKLIYYYNLGLIQPKKEFPESKIVLFNLGDVSGRLKKIDKLKGQGYKLKEISEKINS